MKKYKMIGVILIIPLILLISGCEKSESVDNSNNITTLPSPTSVITIAPSFTPTMIPSPSPTSTPTPTLEELSMQAYNEFLINEEKVSFDSSAFSDDYREQANSCFDKESEYSLSEIVSMLIKNNLEYMDIDKLKGIDYSYIDCGRDGINELVLRFYGMGVNGEDDDSNLVYIIKYIDMKLHVCYSFENWDIAYTTLNEFGYLDRFENCRNSTTTNDYSIIDKDGNCKLITTVTTRGGITSEDSYADDENNYLIDLGELPTIAKKKGISDEFEVIDAVINGKCFYTFTVYGNNGSQVVGKSLYTEGKYKEAFDEAKIPFTTIDDLYDVKIAEKEKELGVTNDIKMAKEVVWKTLDEKMFSDYVVR